MIVPAYDGGLVLCMKMLRIVTFCTIHVVPQKSPTTNKYPFCRYVLLGLPVKGDVQRIFAGVEWSSSRACITQVNQDAYAPQAFRNYAWMDLYEYSCMYQSNFLSDCSRNDQIRSLQQAGLEVSYPGPIFLFSLQSQNLSTFESPRNPDFPCSHIFAYLFVHTRSQLEKSITIWTK